VIRFTAAADARPRSQIYAGAPFYIDGEQEFLLDVSSGGPEGFSLGEPDAHFVSHPKSGWACEAKAA
jgi:hypothetical protein